MKYIPKGSPPTSLIAYARQPDATYKDYPDKDAWSDVLLREQGYLCAYTLQRIAKGRGNMKREHIVPQDGTPANDLNHRNVVAVCLGNEGSPPREQYADTRKGNRSLDRRLSPLNQDCERHFRYNPRGEVRIDDPTLAEQALDSSANKYNSLLNLNHSDLIRGRQSALEAAYYRLGKDEGRWRQRDVETLLERYESYNAEGQLMPYCTVVVYRLRRWLGKWGR